MSRADLCLATTEDEFLGGRLRLKQPERGHRAGLDAVLLAAAVRAEGAKRAADVGAGTGIVGLALAARLTEVTVEGVEIEPMLAALAGENAERNGLGDRVRVSVGDVTGPLAPLEAQGLRRDHFDIVIANPPYLDAATSRASPLPLQARASTMPEAGLEGWVRFLAAVAKSDGALYFIHRADCLPVLLQVLEGRFGGIEILPLHPRAGEAAHRVILRGRKGSRAPLVLLPGLVLHGPDGRFVPEIECVLRAPQPLPWPRA
jgi:tRNA1(Val) A37 N6-methylase TrmN6